MATHYLDTKEVEGNVRAISLSLSDTFDTLEWDIHLTTGNGFKAEFASNSRAPSSRRYELLTKNFPRFIWRATAYYKKQAVLDLLLDATDIEQGNFVTEIIEYDLFLAGCLPTLLKKPEIEADFKKSPARRIAAWYRERPDPLADIAGRA